MLLPLGVTTNEVVLLVLRGAAGILEGDGGLELAPVAKFSLEETDAF
jgi:hypothetical protein